MTAQSITQRGQKRVAPYYAVRNSESCSANASMDEHDMDPRVFAAVQILKRADLSQQIRLHEVAARVNLSTSRLRHLFSQQIGVSPRHYLTILRMQKARHLIDTFFLRIKQVMALVGYSDASDFAHQYKLKFGIAPSVSRRRLNHQTTHSARLANK